MKPELEAKTEDAQPAFGAAGLLGVPIATKDRMPMPQECPCLVWIPTYQRWVSYDFPLDPNFCHWWMPMPPAPNCDSTTDNR